MTQRIVIAGSGFAGMWSALSAARAVVKYLNALKDKPESVARNTVVVVGRGIHGYRNGSADAATRL
ncbi:MAG: hypothetical protein O3C28_00935 [Proteobacteria bacterium]|nr:hypothetical protein [Pseudomonadota bacterium]